MDTSKVTVVDRQGREATAEIHDATGSDFVTVTLTDGRSAEVAKRDLVVNEGVYRLPVCFEEFSPESSTVTTPVAEEELQVHKRTAERRLRLKKQVHTREVTPDQPLFREEFEVKRIPINREVPGPIPIRQEGDAVVISLIEEELVTSKRLVLREEVHISTRRHERRTTEKVTLRSEEISVEPDDPTDGDAG